MLPYAFSRLQSLSACRSWLLMLRTAAAAARDPNEEGS